MENKETLIEIANQCPIPSFVTKGDSKADWPNQEHTTYCIELDCESVWFDTKESRDEAYEWLKDEYVFFTYK